MKFSMIFLRLCFFFTPKVLQLHLQQMTAPQPRGAQQLGGEWAELRLCQQVNGQALSQAISLFS